MPVATICSMVKAGFGPRRCTGWTPQDSARPGGSSSVSSVMVPILSYAGRRRTGVLAPPRNGSCTPRRRNCSTHTLFHIGTYLKGPTPMNNVLEGLLTPDQVQLTDADRRAAISKLDSAVRQAALTPSQAADR